MNKYYYILNFRMCCFYFVCIFSSVCCLLSSFCLPACFYCPNETDSSLVCPPWETQASRFPAINRKAKPPIRSHSGCYPCLAVFWHRRVILKWTRHSPQQHYSTSWPARFTHTLTQLMELAVSQVPVMVNAALFSSDVKLIFRFQVTRHRQQADPFLTERQRQRGRQTYCTA